MAIHNDQICLMYNESLLRQSDIDLLRGPFWLNDTLISFYFDYLQNDKFANDRSLLFISPEVTQCIKITALSEISVEVSLIPLESPCLTLETRENGKFYYLVFLNPLCENDDHGGTKNFIFFALNDNQRIDKSGGSHWSLLAFSRPEQMIFHFDSCSGINFPQAYQLGSKILQYFHLSSDEAFTEFDILQQSNSYDCGVHVLTNVESLAQYAKQNKCLFGWKSPNKSAIVRRRSDILNLISFLRKQPTRD